MVYFFSFDKIVIVKLYCHILFQPILNLSNTRYRHITQILTFLERSAIFFDPFAVFQRCKHSELTVQQDSSIVSIDRFCDKLKTLTDRHIPKNQLTFCGTS